MISKRAHISIISGRIITGKTISRWIIAGLTLLMLLLAWILSAQGVIVGDDMGYCFADPTLHAGGGERVVAAAQVWHTQLSHFLHFNGRFIVHSLTQLMLIDSVHRFYPLLNALIYSFMWIMVSRVVGEGRLHWRVMAGVAGMLWWLMPAPGVIWFSLVAFSTNYLWPAAVAAWLISALDRLFRGKSPSLLLLLPLCLLCGGMQESFSIPLAGGIGLTWLLMRKKMPKPVARKLLYAGIALSVGLILLLAAPGNYAHLQAGGGMGLAAIGRKCASMLVAILRTPLPWLAVLYLILLLRKKTRPLAKPDRIELLLLLAIGCSLLFGVISFTALRQLVAPSLFSIIIMGRILRRLFAPCPLWGKNLAVSMAVAGIAYLAGFGYEVRAESARRMESVKAAVSRGGSKVFVDCSRASYNRPGYWVIERLMDDDPFADDLLHIVFDANTRKGVWRLYSPRAKEKKVPEILPVSRDSLIAAARHLQVIKGKGIYPSRRLDARYALVKVHRSRKLPDLRYPDNTHLPFATHIEGESFLLVVPATPKVKIAHIY